MSTTSGFLGAGIALGLAAGLLVGVGLAQPGRAAATTPSAAPTAQSAAVAVGAPAGLPTVTSGVSTGTAVAASGTAIAYPYFAGSPGIAPDHTIVVTGVGQANMQSGFDRAAVQKTALVAALADARAQADTIATDTGLTITGVLSVSASVSPGYGIVPMAGAASGPNQPTCMPGTPATGPQPTAKPLPAPVCPPQPVYQPTVGVSVTVEYRVG